MNRLAALGIIVVMGVVVSGCGDDSGSTGPSTASRLEGNWSLVAFESASGVENANSSQVYTLEFTPEGHLGTVADCNRCVSTYEAHGLDLNVGGMACTRAFCGPESQSDAFINAVSGASSYLRNGETLLLYYDGGALRLRQN